MTFQNHTALSRPAPMAPRMSDATGLPVTDNMADGWDITDAWFEASGNDEQSAEAFFDHNEDCGEYTPTLVGISVTDANGTFFYSKDATITMMGLNTVWRLEGVRSEELNA